MMEQPKPKCEDIGFEHCWEDITPNIVFTSMPPQYPASQRRCKNCGRHEIEVIKQSEIREWEAA